MNPQVKTRWVEALRSGEYKQGRWQLRQPTAGETEYCCLGVLAVVTPELHGLVDLDLCITPFEKPEVEAIVGFDFEVARDLVSMNDVGGKTFPEIADWVEEHL